MSSIAVVFAVTVVDLGGATAARSSALWIARFVCSGRLSGQAAVRSCSRSSLLGQGSELDVLPDASGTPGVLSGDMERAP